MGAASEGQIAGALGNLIGGIVGAGGLLPHPNATAQFYMRLSEAKAMVESLQMANVEQEHVSAENAATIADSLITAIQLAHGILAGDGDPRLADWVTQTMVGQIEQCL